MEYKFSAPMPYTIDDINKLININKNIKKSKITSLYASLPSTCDFFTGLEQARNIYFKQSNFDYWEKLFTFSLEKGVDFIYLLNNPTPLDLKNPSFNIQLEKLDKLLQKFIKLGINKLRIASPQLMTYISTQYKEFDILASTALEYKSIQEYQNFIMLHPEIKQIVLSHDVNKNFQLVKNLRKNYPHLDIEIMVNEGCMQGCPHRHLHENLNTDKTVSYNNNLALSGKYCGVLCTHIYHKYPFHSLTLNNNIYPWAIKEYAKIGVNNFKLVGRDMYTQRISEYIEEYFLYLKAVDNYKYAKNVQVTTFIHHLTYSRELQQLLVKDIYNYLPKISRFKKYGYLCTSRCGVECRYCYKCAERIEKVFKKKQEEIKKRTMPVCVISKDLNPFTPVLLQNEQGN